MENANKGFYYRRTDYASFYLRFLSVLVDVGVFIIILTIGGVLSSLIFEPFSEIITLVGSFLFLIVYMTVIKASSWRTLGHRLTGIRIIDLHGRKPGLFVMLYRFFLLLFYPFQLPYDFLWLINDPHRQSLRDKMTCAYVIKKNAQPQGEDLMICINYLILGFNFFFREVKSNVDS